MPEDTYRVRFTFKAAFNKKMEPGLTPEQVADIENELERSFQDSVVPMLIEDDSARVEIDVMMVKVP